MSRRYILSKPNPTAAAPAIIERFTSTGGLRLPAGKGEVTEAVIRAAFPDPSKPIKRGGVWDGAEYLPPPGRVEPTSARGARRLRALNVVTLCHSWQVQLHRQVGAIPAALSRTHTFLVRAHQAAWIAFTDPSTSDADKLAWANAFFVMPRDAPTLRRLIHVLSDSVVLPALPLRWFDAAGYSARTVAQTVAAATDDYDALPAALERVDFGSVAWTQEL